MGLFDSIFGGSSSGTPKILEAYKGQHRQLQQIGEASLPQALRGIDMAGGQMPGPLIAPLSEHQQTALGGIGDILSRPTVTGSSLFQQAEQATSDALGGFDPFKDLRFKALQTNLASELKRAKDRIAARTSAGDEFFGGGRIDQEREQEESAFGSMANLAGLLEAESRRNQMAAIPQAMGLAQFANQEPVSRLQESLFGIGAAPRGFEQEQISAEQGDRNRILQELANIGLNTSMNTSMFKPDFYAPAYGPSLFSQLAGGIGSMGGLGEVAGVLGGLGGAGAAAGGLGGITTPLAASAAPELALMFAGI
jgi:hypothetical protein